MLYLQCHFPGIWCTWLADRLTGRFGHAQFVLCSVLSKQKSIQLDAHCMAQRLDCLLAAAAVDSDEEAAAPGPITVKKGMGKQPVAAAFDLLAADGSEPEAEAASDEDESAATAQQGFGALEDGSEAEEAEKPHVQTNGTVAKGGGKAKKVRGC